MTFIRNDSKTSPFHDIFSAKPSWLEELSRKQANRKSGIFGEEKKEKPEPPQQDTKPSIPSKPSQVKEEGNVS